MTKNKHILFSPRIIEHDLFASIGISLDLIEYIFDSGFIPMILPFSRNQTTTELEKKLTHYVENCDGIILQGGKDINLGLTSIRDRYEYNLVKIAIEHHKPLFGICRGMQMINLVLGGSLVDDLGEKNHRHVGTKGDIKNFSNITLDQASKEEMHDLIFETDSTLLNEFNKKYKVNSLHHQAIDMLGNNLKIEAQSDDNIIEIISHKKENIFGVQFHPELDLGNTFYRQIINYWLEKI